MVVLPAPDSVKVYTVNGPASGSSSSLPDWLTRKRAAAGSSSAGKGKRKRVTKERVEGSIELIQHWDFPEASNKVRTTPDGRCAVATGTYKPRVKVWDLEQLGLKFERHTDAENVGFVCLSDDWTKSLHLQSDRSLEAHTQSGTHHRTRIPRFGRCLAYNRLSCDAYVGGAGSEVFRLNLDQGRFLAPFDLASASEENGEGVEGVNAMDVNGAHQLLAFGLDGQPAVQFWDPRSRASVGVLRLPASRLEPPSGPRQAVLPGMPDLTSDALSVSALASRSDGLSYAVGTTGGHTLLYDIRARAPYAIKDQGYGMPIRALCWIDKGARMAGDGLVLSADRKVIKIWDRNSPATNFCSITPATDLNDVHHVPSSGLLLCANEGIQMNTFYVPQLGPAPRWCSFLENVTEEMEDAGEGGRNVYEDFRFVERSELARLGLSHLVGTPAVKPYMHGYFLSLELYDAARAIADPYTIAAAREKAIKDKADKLAESRIRAPKQGQGPSVKVNKALAERVEKEKERERKREERRKARKANRLAGDVDAQEGPAKVAKEDAEGPAELDEADDQAKKLTVLNDPRFQALFENPEFEVDEDSREFALVNPSLAAQRAAAGLYGASGSGMRADVKRRTAVESEDERSERGSSDESEASEGDEAEDQGTRGGERDESESDDSSDAGDLGFDDPRTKRPEARTANVKFVPLRSAGGSSSGRAHGADATFGQRRTGRASFTPASQNQNHDRKRGQRRADDGGMELSWVPSSASASASAQDGGSRGKDGKKPKRKGAHMEMSFGGDAEERGGKGFGDKERSGRTERRKVERSGSRNAIFRRR